MSRVDVEVVRGLFSAVEGEDWDSALAAFDPDVEWSPMEGTFRGREGVGKALLEWLENWDEHHIEAEEVAKAGDHVLAVIHLTGRGRASGLQVDQRFFQLYDVRDGKIARMVEFLTRAEALENARVRE